MSKQDYYTLEEIEAKHPISDQDKAEAEAEIDAAIQGYRIAELRKKAGLTQVQVAERIGVSQHSVSSLESGDINKSGLPTITAYLHAIGATVELIATLDGQAHHIAGDKPQAA